MQLTPHELRLVRLFMENPGKLLTHKAILSAVWGPAYQTESHYLHVYVSQLRRKLEDGPDAAQVSPHRAAAPATASSTPTSTRPLESFLSRSARS